MGVAHGRPTANADHARERLPGAIGGRAVLGRRRHEASGQFVDVGVAHRAFEEVTEKSHAAVVDRGGGMWLRSVMYGHGCCGSDRYGTLWWA